MTRDIGEHLESHKFHYAQSHQNDALGCAVVSEVIKVIKESELIKRSCEIGKEFKDKLEWLKKQHTCIKEIRSRGLMLALEFENTISQSILASVHRELFAEGFLVGYSAAANLFRFYPPLIIEENNIESMITALDQILKL